jgi:5'-nucleotidase
MLTKPLQLSIAIASVLALAGCASVDAPGTPVADYELAILHINDHHSNLTATGSKLLLQTAEGGARKEVAVSLGGFPRVTSAIQALAVEHANVLKLHAGDATTGTLFYTIEHGRADADLMNVVCFDAMAVGNHEFDSGDAGLRQFVDYLWASPDCHTPVLSANVSPRAGSPLGTDTLRGSTVVERGGQAIGIVGLTTAGKTQNSSRPDAGTRLLDEVDSAQAAIDSLRARGINKIVLLSHLGYERDQEIAAQLSGVDVIVGGDSHSLLGDDSLKAYGLSPVGPYPTRATNRDGGQVCIVQAWQYSLAVGELRVAFDNAGEVKACSGQPHLLLGADFGNPGEQTPEALAAIEADVAAQPALRVTVPSAQAEALLAPYAARVEAFGSEAVAAAEQNLCLRRVPGSWRDGSSSRLPGCNEEAHVLAHGGDVQQLVANAFLLQGQRFGGADLSLQNGGGARVDLAIGTLSVDDIYKVLPFRNTLVRLSMSGAEVRAALEDAVDRVVAGNTGAYPYAGGLRWDVDLNRPFGARLANLEQRNAAGEWLPLDPGKTYQVIASDFIASGHDGYTTLATIGGERRVDTYLAYADSFLQYARDNGSLKRPASSDYSTQSFIDTSR